MVERVRTAALAAAVTMMAVVALGASKQNSAPEDLAGKLTGTWILNRDLSSGFRAPAGRRSGGALAPRPSFAVASMPQRGGGGRGAGSGNSDATDLTPGQRAEQAAMQHLQQIAAQITIKASADSITFIDARGERTFAINNKSSKVDVAGSQVNVKSKWDKGVLKQEFSNTQAKLVETWGLDDASRLVLTAKVESMTLRTPEQRAVFDRQ
jgi:hypothetical protein